MDWDGIGSLNGILLRAPLGGVNNLFDSKRSQKTHKYLQVLERAELAEENAPISFLNRDCKPCRLVAWLHMVSLASTKSKFETLVSFINPSAMKGSFSKGCISGEGA